MKNAFKALRRVLARIIRPRGKDMHVLQRLGAHSLSGSDWLLLPNDAIAQHLMRGDEWEPHFGRLVRELVKPGDLVLDIGANFGFHTLTLAKQVGPSGRVLAFEPLRLIFQQLCANVFLNRMGNVYPYNRAVAEISGRQVEMNPVNFDSDWVNIGDTRVGSGGDRAETLAIDDLRLDRVHFIKLDVQGYELFALQGADETLTRSRPFIFIEIEEIHLRAFGCSSKQLMEHLLARGYRLLRILTDYPCDHLAVPQELEISIPRLEKCLGYGIEVISGSEVNLLFTSKFGGATYEKCISD